MVHSLSKPSQRNPFILLLRKSKTASQIFQIHAQLITTNLISDPLTSSQLLASIASQNEPNVDYAGLVFYQIYQHDVFKYNSVIKGYISSSNPEKAWSFYVNMRRSGVEGDSYTYPFVLKACRRMMGLAEGRQVHGEIVKRGCCDVFAANGLIGMYGKCGEIGCAKMVFYGTEEKDLVSWNLILGALVDHGKIEDAQKVFDQIPEKDVVSWSIMIDAYGKRIGDVHKARLLFDSMPFRDLVSWNSMIARYVNVGELVAARELFDLMPEKNVISWTIMLDGYASYGDPLEALKIFRQMLCEGINIDKVSVIGALSACAQLGALVQGRWIHILIERCRLDMDIVVKTALLDMYVKCGSLDEASRIFHGMSERNAICYNVMIVGFGINGQGQKALKCFSEMVSENVQMDDMLFLGVLTACSHAGFVKEGLSIFKQVKEVYGIEPKLEHFACLADLLSRSGQIDNAREVIESLPIKFNSAALWGSLLLACRNHQDLLLAKVSVQKLAEMKADDYGTYVLLANIYADIGLYADSSRVWKLLKDKNLIRGTGKSSIEVNGIVKEFVSGDKSCVVPEEMDWVIWSISKIPLHVGISLS